MATLAPGLWGLLSTLTHVNVDVGNDEPEGKGAAETVDGDEEYDEFFNALDGLEDENLLACETQRSQKKRVRRSEQVCRQLRSAMRPYARS